MITDAQIKYAEKELRRERKLLPVVGAILRIIKTLPEDERLPVLRSAAAYYGIQVGFDQ